MLTFYYASFLTSFHFIDNTNIIKYELLIWVIFYLPSKNRPVSSISSKLIACEQLNNNDYPQISLSKKSLHFKCHHRTNRKQSNQALGILIFLNFVYDMNYKNMHYIALLYTHIYIYIYIYILRNILMYR